MPFVCLSTRSLTKNGFHRKNCSSLAILRSRKRKTVSVILFLLITLVVIVAVLRSTGVMEHLPAVTDSRENLNDSALSQNYSPWPNDSLCKNSVIKFIPNCNQVPVALVSYPGSGNTYTRGIIERLTGFFTGSLYEDKHLYSSGFYGEILPANSGCTIVQKTHESDFKSYQMNSLSNGRAIIILRNPYKALISFRNLYFTHDYDHVSNGASTDSFSGPDWDNFVSIEILNWKSNVIRWISEKVYGRREDIHVFHYENLIGNDQANQFRKLVNSLNLTVDEHRLNCTLKHGYATFKRNSVIKTMRDPFTPQQREAIDEAIAEVQIILKEMNFELLPLHLYS